VSRINSWDIKGIFLKHDFAIEAPMGGDLSTAVA
jgi:hypothetical protein